jgi:DNA-binding MurR/RpiR family transcriptional regulator
MQYEKDILPIIKLHYEEFSTAEKTAADYFLNNKYKENFSAKEVAERLFISEATLSRFAKKCGYTGYRQFVFHYQEQFASEGVRILRDETRHILDTYQELLNHSYTLVDEKAIKQAGAAGVIRPSKTTVQVIIGPKVQFVFDELKKIK